MKKLIICCLLLLFTSILQSESWPQFRGPTGDGVSTAENVPTQFGPDEGVKWKTELPGRGWSSPVIDGGTLWVTTAKESFPSAEERLEILRKAGENEKILEERQVATHIDLAAVSIDYETGAILRNVPLLSIENPQTIHTLNSFASPTPVLTDGVLFAHFGAFGTFAVDTATGEILWQTKIALDHGVGPGSSPVVSEGRLFLICDGIDRQFVTALDCKSGKSLWTTDRPAMRALKGAQKKSFNTPLVIKGRDRREQIVCMGAQWLVSYAPESGKELWRLDHGSGFSVVPRPVYSEKTGLIYLSTGFGKPELLAVRPDGSGDISGSDKIVWRESKRIPAQPSPLLVGDELYVISDGGIASCFDAFTGTIYWTERIQGNYSASPLFADGHIYVANQEGTVSLFKPGKTFVLEGQNQMGETIMASPIALDGSLLLRTGAALYRF